MSKIEKFLSIGIGILQETENDFQEIDAKKLYKAMNVMETFLFQRNIFYKKEQSQQPQGKLSFLICDEMGNATCAQVKFFPYKDEDKEYQLADDKIGFIREITDHEGILKIELPYGKYIVEISKGSEYEIITLPILINKKENKTINMTLTRFINLEKMKFYAGDLHHHSVYSSPLYGGDDDVKELPAQVAQSMQAMGLRFGALSDHHNILNHQVWKKEKSTNFYPIISKEISTSNGHVMSLGVSKDIIYHIPEKEERTEDKLRDEFRRVTKEMKELGGLAQLNHPRDLSTSISWNPKFYDMIDIFETMEIWNGSNPMYYGTTNALAARLWIELLEKGIYIPATTGSDTHNIKANDYHKIFEEIIWLHEQMNFFKESSLKVQYTKEIECLGKIVEKVMPIMEKWIEANLTSGGVRTYVNIKEELNTSSILDGLRKGHSFLTNGPILIAKIGEKSFGEKVIEIENNRKIKLTILSNKPLKYLRIYGNLGFIKIFDLIEKEETKNVNHYNYSTIVAIDKNWNCDWFFFLVADDCTNMAITNPIFIE